MDKETEIKSVEIEILRYLNELAGKRFRPIKSNLRPISARLKEGYTADELKEIILVKTLEWKNNEVMNAHLCPTTLFRPSNADKYMNQILAIKKDPHKYGKYFAKINKRNISNTSDNTNELTEMYGE